MDVPQQTISRHLPKMPVMANPVNSDLLRGFTVSQVAEKHNWTEPMVWSFALEDKVDLERFKGLWLGAEDMGPVGSERLRQEIRRRLAGAYPRAIDRTHPLLFLKTERPDP